MPDCTLATQDCALATLQIYIREKMFSHNAEFYIELGAVTFFDLSRIVHSAGPHRLAYMDGSSIFSSLSLDILTTTL